MRKGLVRKVMVREVIHLGAGGETSVRCGTSAPRGHVSAAVPVDGVREGGTQAPGTRGEVRRGKASVAAATRGGGHSQQVDVTARSEHD